jgi:hypothetical protein
MRPTKRSAAKVEREWLVKSELPTVRPYEQRRLETRARLISALLAARPPAPVST